MLEVIGTIALVTVAWATLIWCAGCALRPYLRERDERALADQDSFTPSMARWGYVGERRGQR